MFSQPVDKTTNDIRVEVSTAYIADESSPLHNHYLFAYRINIINESPYKVQLLRRKWFITDAYGHKRVVEGEGVIGKQPTLGPDESHSYVSGCDFSSPIGKMEGYYIMYRVFDGKKFQVKIPSFIMTVPFVLN